MKKIVVLLCIAVTCVWTQSGHGKSRRKTRSKYLLELPEKEQVAQETLKKEIKATISEPKETTKEEKTEEAIPMPQIDMSWQEETTYIPQEQPPKKKEKERRPDLIDRFLKWSHKKKKEPKQSTEIQAMPVAMPAYLPTPQPTTQKPQKKQSRLDFIDRFLKGKKEKKESPKKVASHQMFSIPQPAFTQIPPGTTPFGIHNITSQLYRIEQDVARQLRQEISNNIRRIAVETKEEMQRIAQQKQEEQRRLIQEIQESTKRKITQAEIKLLEEQINSMKESLGKSYTHSAHRRKKPISKNDLSTWKKQSKENLQENITYLGEILQSDPELYKMLQKKMDSLELMISTTKTIGDQSYKSATKELHPLTKLYQTQKLADLLLGKALKTTEADDAMRENMRLIILYELQPLVEKALKTDDEISTEKVQDIVLLAIKEVKQKQKPMESIQVPRMQFSISDEERDKENTDLEQSKEMLSKLTLLEKEVAKQKQALKEQEAETKRLRKNLSALAKEKIELEILVEKTKQELKQAVFNNEKLNQFKNNLELMKNKLQKQQEKYIEVKILLERSKQNLELIKLDKKEKERRNKQLESQIQKAKEDLQAAHMKIQKIDELQKRLTDIQTSVQTLKQERNAAQEQYTQARTAYAQAQYRSKHLEKENEELKIKQIAILEKYAEIASIRRDIHELEMQLLRETDPEEQKEIRKEIDEERAELREAQQELRRLVAVKKLHTQAKKFAEQARTTQLEASITAQRKKGAINHLLTSLVKDIQEPMDDMRSEGLIESIVDQVREDLNKEEPPAMEDEEIFGEEELIEEEMPATEKVPAITA